MIGNENSNQSSPLYNSDNNGIFYYDGTSPAQIIIPNNPAQLETRFIADDGTTTTQKQNINWLDRSDEIYEEELLGNVQGNGVYGGTSNERIRSYNEMRRLYGTNSNQLNLSGTITKTMNL